MDGEIQFTSEKITDPMTGLGIMDYRTRVAPSFHHTGVIYYPSNNNMRYALRRQFSMRLLDRDPTGKLCQSYHDRLENIRKIDLGINFSYIGYGWVDLIMLFAHLPHAKRLLRIHARKEQNDKGQLYKRLWRSMNGFMIKMKRAEWAKMGKFPRTIGDLGVAASLQGAFFIDVCKHHLASRFYTYFGRSCKFVKSVSLAALIEVFGCINDPTSSNCFFCFSDDGIYRTRKGLIYNLDISSCDSTHRQAIFDLLIELFPGCDDCMRILVEQLCQRMTIYSSDRAQKVVIESLGPVLYSGSTITTLINTIAMFLIFYELERCEAETPQEILDAAAGIGYILGEPELCLTPGDQQFLKHSPVGPDYFPVMNFGVFQRASGITKGDLPGGLKNLAKNGKIFQGMLLHGMYPRVRCPLINRMMNKWPLRSDRPRIEKVVAKHLPYSTHTPEDSGDVTNFSDSDFFARYQATNSEISELSRLIDAADDSDIIFTELSNRVFNKDYGLGYKTLY